MYCRPARAGSECHARKGVDPDSDVNEVRRTGTVRSSAPLELVMLPSVFHGLTAVAIFCRLFEADCSIFFHTFLALISRPYFLR